MERRNTFILRRTAACMLLVAILIACAGCRREEKEVRQEFSQLAPICELATLKCYYHNVAESESGSGFPFNLRHQKTWIEYSGIVRVGIDAGKVRVSHVEGQDGVVQVTIPKAEVLDIDFDEDSINKISEAGLFAKVSSQKDVEIFNKAQQDMEQTATNDQTMLAQAQSRAKMVLEKYIQKCGEAVGKTYTVKWIELDDDSSAPEAQPTAEVQPSAST